MAPFTNIKPFPRTPSIRKRRQRRVVLAAIILLISLFAMPASQGTALTRPASAHPGVQGEGEMDIGALIGGLQTKYSRMGGLAANFVQIYQGADGRVRRESGRVLLKRPAKARWEYTSPEHKQFISDGKSIFFYVEGDKEAAESPIKESVDPQIPFLFLLGRGNLRRDFSRIELLANEPVATAGNRVLLLIPKRAPEDFRKLMAEVNPATFEVRRLVVFQRNGARMEFLLSDVRENYVASDHEFIFTPPRGVTVRRAQ